LLRHPFTVAEIFNCEVNTFTEKFFEAPERKQSEDESEEVKDKSNNEKEEKSEPADSHKNSAASDEEEKSDKDDFFDAKGTKDEI
jgi:hypothetical protein